MIDEQRQALCVAILAGNKYCGNTSIIGLVQLGAVVDEQRQALCVALLAGNICWGTTFIIDLVQLGAVVDQQRQAVCVAFWQAIYAGVQPRLCQLTSTPLRRICRALPTSPSLHAMHSDSSRSTAVGRAATGGFNNR